MRRTTPHITLKLAVVVHTLENQRHYLIRGKCDIYTNHKNLKYYIMQNGLNMRQHRWLESIKDYDLEIHYHPGKACIVVNALNRNSYCNTLMALV